MIIKKTEYRRVNSTLIKVIIHSYDIEEEAIVEQFGSVKSFLEHFEEESDEFHKFVMDFDEDDRKGGYDVDWEIE
jgi:hypothetical protein